MGRDRLRESFMSALPRLRDGDLDRAKTLKRLLSWSGLELHSRAIVGSAKVCWVLDIRHNWYLHPRILSDLDSWLRLVNAIQTSLNDWLESGRPTLMYSLAQSCWDATWEGLPEEASIPSYAVVVSAVVLLSLVYQYLTGNVDRGGSRAYSRTSLDFRDIYVAIVLFLGAYVWIKFREVAFRGVHPRTLKDKQGGTKVVYDARLKPPLWNGEKVQRLDLGRFATPQEAHNKFLIAAFYYNRDAGLLDGWFQVPPMSEEERSLTGKEKRKWVIGQAKKVYEDFTKKKAEAKEKEEAAWLLQEWLEVWDDQLTPEQDEVNVDFSMSSLLNSAEHQQPALASQVENSVMGMAMLDKNRLECTSHSFEGMHEGLALSNGHGLGFEEGSALPISQLPPNTESGMSLNGSDQVDLLQSLVGTQPQQISLQHQQFSDQQQQISFQQQQISLLQQQIQGLGAQILQLQQLVQQRQQLQESRIQNPQWSCQFYFEEQQLQEVNQGVPSSEMEIEQGMHQRCYARPPDGGEGQEAFI